jgi:hypothetical protein
MCFDSGSGNGDLGDLLTERIYDAETARILFRASGPPYYRNTDPSAIAEKQAEVVLPVVLAGLESSPFFGVFVQTWTSVAQ